MNSELDKIKSTITISLGTKNRLRKLKGGQSYEDYINYLLRVRNQKEPKADNQIEIQKFERKTGVYSFEDFKIVFTYNEYNQSQNFIFDISVNKVRKKGKLISFEKYLKGVSKKSGINPPKIENKDYFQLLQIAIQQEIEPLFKHKGRIEDYYLWEQEFKVLNLPKKSLEEDVMDKLNQKRL